MSWLQAADTTAFRFINQKLSHPLLDAVMPVFAGGRWFVSLAILGGILLLWKGGVRARLFVLVLGLVLALGDAFVVLPIKKAISRPRPSHAIADAKLSPWIGKGKAQSMPSSHASTWAAASLIAFAYYPRSRNILVPVTLLICFSRVYLGAHYPSDVIAGMILGGGYAAAGLWTLQTLWRWAGPKWFSAWYEKVPSLIVRTRSPSIQTTQRGPERSKPAGSTRTDMIAVALSIVILKFFERMVNAGAAFFLVLITSLTALLAGGSMLTTIDDKPGEAPREILQQFEAVTDLGPRQVEYRKRVFHAIQLFACRNLL